MYKKSYEHSLIMQATIEANRQDSDEKMKKITEDLTALSTQTITSMMYHINIERYSPDQKDIKKSQYPTTVVPTNKRSPPLECVQSMKICSMWNLKHDISSPKFYDILIKT